MGRRRSTRRPARGGEGIQALRKARARIALAAGSLFAYGATLAYVVTLDRMYTPATAGLGVVGALVLVFALLRLQEEAITPALGCIGVAYAIAVLAHGNEVEQRAPLVASVLLLCGELGAWSIAERHAIPAERSVWTARAVGVAGLAFGGLAVATLVIGLAATSAGAGLAWTALGTGAAVGVVALATVLARRAP